MKQIHLLAFSLALLQLAFSSTAIGDEAELATALAGEDVSVPIGKDSSSFAREMRSLMEDIGSRAESNMRRRGLTNPGTLSTADKQRILDLHNTYRSTTALGNAKSNRAGTSQPYAANMEAMLWDASLEATAAAYIATCPGLVHNSNRQAQTYAFKSRASFTHPSNGANQICVGENLYVSSTSPVAMDKMWGTSNYGVMGGIDGWYQEDAEYYFGDKSCTGVCGHYTQGVWAISRYVGCGFYHCSSAQWKLQFICNYAPCGNWNGEAPYEEASNSGLVASKCPSDRTRNSDTGLCEGGVCSNFENDNTCTTNNCDDGLGRDLCSGTGVTPSPTAVTSSPTNRPTPAPVVTPSPTLRPTLNPVIPAPSHSPTTPAPTEVVTCSGSSNTRIVVINAEWTAVSWNSNAGYCTYYAGYYAMGVNAISMNGWRASYGYRGNPTATPSGYSYANFTLYGLSCATVSTLQTTASGAFQADFNARFVSCLSTGSFQVTSSSAAIVDPSTSSASGASLLGGGGSDSSGSLDMGEWNGADWFVFIFVLFVLFAAFFVAGYCFHKKRIEKAALVEYEDDEINVHGVRGSGSAKTDNDKDVPLASQADEEANQTQMVQTEAVEVGVSFSK